MSASVSDDRSGSITIVLVDRQPIVRAGLRLLFEREGDLRVVGETADAGEAPRLLAGLRPSVLVLDVPDPDALRSPGSVAADGTRRRTRALVLGPDRDPDRVREAMRAGAHGFVGRDESPRALLIAIRSLGTGGTRLPPEPGLPTVASAPRGPHELSAREREVLALIALGYTNGEIASRLFLSVRTVESHRAHIQHKTQRNSRAELVAHARELGLA